MQILRIRDRAAGLSISYLHEEDRINHTSGRIPSASFVQALDGLKPAEFEHYGAASRTLRNFVKAYHDLQGVIRDLVLPERLRGEEEECPGSGILGKRLEDRVWDNGQACLEVNPILDWTEMDVWSHIAEAGLPYCSLYGQGYRSLGCMPCTVLPTGGTGAGEDERAGRDPDKEAQLGLLRDLGYF